jgi:hypothetical protein
MKRNKWMKFGTWNIWSLLRTGALKMVVRELGKCKLDIVNVDYAILSWSLEYRGS